MRPRCLPYSRKFSMLEAVFPVETENKCVSKTDTNPPFAFQIAFPRGTDFTIPFESNLESNRRIVVYSFSVNFF